MSFVLKSGNSFNPVFKSDIAGRRFQAETLRLRVKPGELATLHGDIERERERKKSETLHNYEESNISL